jgi:hypothetical protein
MPDVSQAVLVPVITLLPLVVLTNPVEYWLILVTFYRNIIPSALTVFTVMLVPPVEEAAAIMPPRATLISSLLLLPPFLAFIDRAFTVDPSMQKIPEVVHPE